MATRKTNNGINLVDYRESGVIDKIKLVGKSLFNLVDTAGEVVLTGSEVIQGISNYPLNKVVNATDGDIQQYTQDKIDQGTNWVIDQFVPSEEEPVKEEAKKASSTKEDKIKRLLESLDEDKLDKLLKTLES